MEQLILFYYFLTLFPGLAAIGLAYAVSLRHQSPLSLRYVRVFSLLLIYLTQMVVVYYCTHVLGIDPLLVETWSQPLYQVIYSLWAPFVAGFMLELLQIPHKGWTRLLSVGLCVAGLLLIPLVFLAYPEMDARIEAFRFWTQLVYVPLFLVFLLGLLVLYMLKLRGINDPWKQASVRGTSIITLAFFPVFVLDTLWPLLQMKFRIIPEGLNLFGFYFMTISGFYFFRWRVFLRESPERPSVEFPPKSAPPLDSDRLTALCLTEREEDVVRMIFRGGTNQDISDGLSITLGTVKNHIYNIFQKSGASSRRELIRMLMSEPSASVTK